MCLLAPPFTATLSTLLSNQSPDCQPVSAELEQLFLNSTDSCLSFQVYQLVLYVKPFVMCFLTLELLNFANTNDHSLDYLDETSKIPGEST